jgi:arylsulfatase A-like enzyme
VLAKLKKLKLDDNTLVVFTSDNGPWFGGSSGGLRGMKGTSWEGGYRVPFIARWPGTIPAGHVSDQPAVTMDLFATSLKIGGIAAPSDRVIDGADIRPLLTSNAKSPHAVVIGAQGPHLATARDARWKLHVIAANDRGLRPAPNTKWVDPRAPDGVTLLAPYEQYQPSDLPGITTGDTPTAMALFDLSTDPNEQHNVADANPDVAKRLKAEFDKFAKDVPADGTKPSEKRKKPKR